MPFIMAFFGYVFSIISHTILLKFESCLGQNSPVCLQKAEKIKEYKTFALISGIQNNRLSLAILASWTLWEFDGFSCPRAFLEVNVGPALYGFSQVLCGVVAVCLNGVRHKNRDEEGDSEREVLK